jgi:holin-like protein
MYNMIRQCAVIFGCLAVGELVVSFTGIKIPSSIIGMLLLAFLLKLGWIKLFWVKNFSDVLIKILPFLFVPAGVAIMLYFNIITPYFWPIIVSSLGSTIIVLVVTGWVHQLLRDKRYFISKKADGE